MTDFQRRIKTTRSRLCMNDWFHWASVFTLVAAGLFGITTIVERLFALGIPLGWTLVGVEGAALVTATIVALSRRIDDIRAAARLDEAANLRERVSSGILCMQSQDPFAQAVVTDAERTTANLNVRSFIRYRAPRTLAWTVIAWILVPTLLFLPNGMLAPQRVVAKEATAKEVTATKAVVKKRFEDLKQMAKNNEALRDLKDQLDALDKPLEAPMTRPDDIRNDAVKKIENLSDALRQKREQLDQEKVDEMKKMLRRMEMPEESKTPTEKLQKALAQGDLKEANKAIKDIQQQLATLKPPQDKERIQEVQKQLENIAKALESAANDEQIQKKLEQAGIDKQMAERALKNLTKKDLEAIKKQLEESGLTQQQIQKLAQQLQQRQSAAQAAQQMAQAMQQASQAAQMGDMQGAEAGLESAAGQLSELEQLEQQLSEMESTLANLDSMKNQLDKPCPSCSGAGCGQCQGQGNQPGQGGGQGKLGQGAGNLARQEETSVGFKIERTKVNTVAGKIIGQFLIDGEQIEGESSAQIKEVTRAALRDATDAVNRDRVPRQYQSSVKKYFSDLAVDVGVELPDETEGAEASASDDANADADDGDDDDSETADDDPE